MKRVTHKHGGSYTPEYRAWQTMRLRCTVPTNRAWPDYGGRGITVCDRWRDDFRAFLADMGSKPSSAHEIDRIDNDRGYEPGNCRWVTRSENNRNRRSTLWIEYQGERRRRIDLAEEFGIPSDTLAFRLRSGWSVEEALTTPVRQKLPDGEGWRRRPKSTRVTRSGCVGVDWSTQKERWRARAMVNGVRHDFCYFRTVEAAVAARASGLAALVRANVVECQVAEAAS